MRKATLLILVLILAFVGQSFAWFNFSLDTPLPRLRDHSAIDIVYDGTYIWLATGNGVSGTSDGGTSWITFNEQTGFTHSSISAMTGDGERLWAATSYDTLVTGNSLPVGGGIQITADFGDNWQLIDSTQFSRVGKVAYDLAVYDSSTWAACFYGGLVRSLDYGQTWENIFIDDAVRNDYENKEYRLDRARYYSAIVDPFHDDSVLIWAGSAEGVQRIYYIDKSKKLAGNRINDIACDSIYWWYATDRGLSRLSDTAFSLVTLNFRHTFLTYDSSDGFMGNFVSAVGAEGNLVCAGIYDTLAEQSLGFVISSDGGLSWSVSEPTQAVGAGKMIEEIEVYLGSIWAGCNEGGFICSRDSGQSWNNYYLDSTVTGTDDLRNIVHGFDLADREGYTRIHAGTDSGIVIFYLSDSSTTLDSTSYLEVADCSAYGQKIVSVTTLISESGEQVWAAAHPYHQDGGAAYAVIRAFTEFPGWDAFLNASPPIVPYDIEVYSLASTVSIWVAHDYGLYTTTNEGGSWESPMLIDAYSQAPQVVVIDDDAPFLCVEASERHLHTGSLEYGALRMLVPIVKWYNHRAHLDPLQFDFVGRSYLRESVTGPEPTEIGANWIRALGLQRTGDSTIIWAATEPNPYANLGGHRGVSITTDRGKTWREVAEVEGEKLEVWNFAFNGDSAFLAASQGLYLSTDFGTTWDQFVIADPHTGRVIDSLTLVLSACVIEGEIWVGTENGIGKSTGGVDWEIFTAYHKPDPSYGCPNPFSPYAGTMKFVYKLTHGGDVTIRIYDFANNLVKTIRGSGHRLAGEQYDAFEVWDGRNERKDIVAAGVYIYVIESTGGDELWGKIMVLP